MNNQDSSNVKTGLLVIAGIFLFILTLFIIGKRQDLFGATFEVKAHFANLNGLSKGNNIRFAGIQAGTVKSIRLIDDTTVEVTMRIDDAMKPYILKNAMVSIGTEGLIGNSVINIIPGKGPAAWAERGDLLASQKSMDKEEILQTFYKIHKNAEDISENLKITARRINSSKALWDIFGDTGLSGNIKKSMNNISEASIYAKNVARDLNSIVGGVKNGKG